MQRRPRPAPAPSAPPADVRVMELGARLLVWLAVALAFAAAGYWTLHRPVFNFRAVRVDGDLVHNTAATIRAGAMPHLSGNYFTVRLRDARRAFESVPWVRRAFVRRVWPDRLAVTLEEHRPAAFWHRDEGDDALVNTYGEVFEVNLGDVDDQDLPTLRGPDGSAPQVLDMYSKLSTVFAPMSERVDELELTQHGSWSATLTSGTRVELGRGTADEVLARATRFAGSVGQVVAKYNQPLVYADLRHRDGYAVRLRGVGTVGDGVNKLTAHSPR